MCRASPTNQLKSRHGILSSGVSCDSNQREDSFALKQNKFFFANSIFCEFQNKNTI